MHKCPNCQIQETIEDCGCLLCSRCGLVLRTQYQYTTSLNNHSEPLQLCMYQRKKRFMDILTKIVFPSIDNKDAPVYEELNKHKPYESIGDIIDVMKGTKCKDKRYCSLHTFCKHFLTGYTAPRRVDFVFMKLCSNLFTSVETLFLNESRIFKGKGRMPFFNYNWLINRVLQALGNRDYEPYIKRIKCPKRNKHYSELFKNYYTQILTRDNVPLNQEITDAASGHLLNFRGQCTMSQHHL